MLVKAIKFGREEKAACTSLDVAQTFKKRHDHVLRDINELGCSPEFRLPNFGETYKVSFEPVRLEDLRFSGGNMSFGG